MANEAEALRAPPEGALKLARQKGGATGELCERIAWALDPEAFEIWEREYDRQSGSPSKGPTWDQLAVAGRRATARATASMLICGPLSDLIHRSALAEDTARAAEDMRERCAEIAAKAEDQSSKADSPYDNGSGSCGYEMACFDIFKAIRALPLTKEAADPSPPAEGRAD